MRSTFLLLLVSLGLLASPTLLAGLEVFPIGSLRLEWLDLRKVAATPRESFYEQLSSLFAADPSLDVIVNGSFVDESNVRGNSILDRSKPVLPILGARGELLARGYLNALKFDGGGRTVVLKRGGKPYFPENFTSHVLAIDLRK